MSHQTTEIEISEKQITESKLNEEFREAQALIQSGMLPSRFKSPQQLMAAYRMAKETGLQPIISLRQMAVINGTPSFFGDLPKAMVDKSGKLESFKEFLIDKDYKEICFANKNMDADPWAAVCVVKRKEDPELMERFFTMKDAERAGLLRNPVWKTYPHRMLTYRARSMALKDKFADCLNGISISEYDHNTTVIDGNVVESDYKNLEHVNERFK